MCDDDTSYITAEARVVIDGESLRSLSLFLFKNLFFYNLLYNIIYFHYTDRGLIYDKNWRFK